MQAFQLDAWGLENLRTVTREDPQLAEAEVLVRLRAMSLNYRDWLVVRGKYNPRYPLPLVPCSDGAGEVIGVGSQVNRWKVGDRVMPICAPTWQNGSPDRSTLKNTLGGPADGTLRECMVVNQEALGRVPDHLNYEEAATLPCAALTAWSSLVTYGVDTEDHAMGGQPGTVLVLGTGGVSIFAVQLAKALGMRVICTSSSDEKLARAQSLGVDDVINYREHTDWDRRVYEITEGRGVDNVIEVGGAGTLARSVRSVRPGGVISLIGVLAGNAEDLNLTGLLMHNIRVQGIFVGHRAGFESMCETIQAKKLKPVIDRSYSFSDAAQAIQDLAHGKHFGKLVIQGVPD